MSCFAIGAAAADGEVSFNILKLSGNHVHWQQAGGQGLVVTYGLVTSARQFPGARNCRNMVPLDPDRFSVNQDAMVKLVGWAGNMTLSNAFLQGVLYNT